MNPSLCMLLLQCLILTIVETAPPLQGQAAASVRLLRGPAWAALGCRMEKDNFKIVVPEKASITGQKRVERIFSQPCVFYNAYHI